MGTSKETALQFSSVASKSFQSSTCCLSRWIWMFSNKLLADVEGDLGPQDLVDLQGDVINKQEAA